MTVSVEKLYELCEVLDNAKDKISEHQTEYTSILEGAKGGASEKRLAGQLIVRYFHKFPEARESALDALFELCEDDDVNIRKPVIKNLPTLCKKDEKGPHVSKVADVLTQLLQTDDQHESQIVHGALMQMLSRFTKETLSTIFGHIINAEEDVIRERAVKFVAVKLKFLTPEQLTRELEDFVLNESKKVLQDVTGEEFIIFIHLLSNLPHLQTVTGRQLLVDLITEQADLDKSFEPEDPDRVDQVCQCVKQAIPFLSKNVQSTKMLSYILEQVLPFLEQIKIEGNESIQLEFLRLIADLAPHCGDLENADAKLQPLLQKLVQYLPLPPSAESTSNGAADTKEVEEDPKLQFSEIESLLWALHQLSKKHSSFWTGAKTGDEGKLLVKRLTYLARMIQVYSKKLRATLTGATKSQLGSEENKIKAVAFKTTTNIFTILTDLLKTQPSYKATITPSWGKTERRKSVSQYSDEPPKKAARKTGSEIQRYQVKSGQYSAKIDKFEESSNWQQGGGFRGNRGRGGFRGRGRGFRRY